MKKSIICQTGTQREGLKIAHNLSLLLILFSPLATNNISDLNSECYLKTFDNVIEHLNLNGKP